MIAARAAGFGRPVWLLVFVLFLVVAIVYSRVAHNLFVPDELSLVPKEFAVVVVTGPLNELAAALEDHFPPAADESVAQEQIFASLAPSLRATLESLGEAGFDPATNATIGIRPERDMPALAIELRDLMLDEADDEELQASALALSNSLKTIVTLKVCDPSKVDDELASTLEELEMTPNATLAHTAAPPDRIRERSRGADCSEPAEVLEGASRDLWKEMVGYRLDGEPAVNLAIAHASDDRVSLSNAPDWLRRGIEGRRSNQRFYRNDDALFEGARRLARAPLGEGAQLFAMWTADDLPVMRRMTASIDLQPEALRVGMWLDAHKVGLTELDAVFARPPAGVDWESHLPLRTAAVLTLQDHALQRYQQLLERFGVVSEWIDGAYIGVMGEIRRVDGLQRLVVAVTGYDRGLPELLTGAWADKSMLAQTLADFQLRTRIRRDRIVLRDAAAELLAAEPAAVPTVANLRAAGLLKPESPSFFDRYRYQDGRYETDLVQEDLKIERSGYVRPYGSHVIEYLMPEVTGNDGFTAGEPRRRRKSGNEFRLAHVTIGDVVWVATQAAELERLIDRVESAGESLRDNRLYQLGAAGRTTDDKLQLFVDMDRIIGLGLLSPEADLQEAVKMAFLEFKQHPSISFTLRPAGDRIIAQASMFRRTGAARQ